MDNFDWNSDDDIEIKRIKRTTSIFSIFIALILILLIGSIIFLKSIFSQNEELITKTVSNDGKYIVEAYLINGGATVDWAVRCYLKINNRLGKKTIYNDYHIDKATMSWEDDDTININGHTIDLPDGKFDYRYD